MFGCVVAGRLLQTQLTQVDETHAYFELPNAESINHISLFLLGTVPFPDGYGCTVHLFWPSKGFQLLGMLSNEKPSAIFRLRGSFSAATNLSTAQQAFSQQSVVLGTNTAVTAILGLSIEPLDEINTQISGMPSSASTTVVAAVRPTEAVVLAERIVKNMMDYLHSFAPPNARGDTAVPLAIIQKWYESFQSKVKAGRTAFLERDEP